MLFHKYNRLIALIADKSENLIVTVFAVIVFARILPIGCGSLRMPDGG